MRRCTNRFFALNVQLPPQTPREFRTERSLRRQLNVQSKKTVSASSHLGQSIKSHRLEKNISQSALAEMLGVSPQAVSKWERGIALPDIDLLIPLANIFSITLDRLLGREKYDK